jgi:DNA-binding NarL/FixJ family response regulator
VFTIGILENDINLRQTLENYVKLIRGQEVAFSYGSFKELTDNVGRIKPPKVVLLDIHLDDVKGVNVIQNIKRMFTGTDVIIITGEYDSTFIMKAIENGANGYVYKPFSAAKLEQAIANVESTGSFLDPESLTKLMTMMQHSSGKKFLRTEEDLTPMEQKIIELVKKGLTYKEMAQDLNISFHTVNFHLKNIYYKMDVKSKAELISLYLD